MSVSRLLRLRSFWHPHQKLWNWDLVETIGSLLSSCPFIARLAVHAVVTLDSFLLGARVLARRITFSVSAAYSLPVRHSP